MPTYQYVCNDCGESLEAVQKFSDDGLTECPSCLGRLRKVYSAVGVVFKGSGFYRTDSRSSSASGSGSIGKSDGKSDAKSDAPAAKSADSKPSTATSSAPTSKSSTDGGSGAPPAKKSGDSKVA